MIQKIKHTPRGVLMLQSIDRWIVCLFTEVIDTEIFCSESPLEFGEFPQLLNVSLCLTFDLMSGCILYRRTFRRFCSSSVFMHLFSHWFRRDGVMTTVIKIKQANRKFITLESNSSSAFAGC